MPDPIPRFAALVAGPDAEVDLARASLAVAAGAEPALDPEPWLEALDRFAEGLDEPGGLIELRRRLFSELGFAGNTADYYDERNSFLNHVIERRLGNPLSLSIVTIEVGRRAGIEFDGIGMPGHFLVRHRRTELFLDAFCGGGVLDLAECEARWRQISGVGPYVPFRPSMLDPVGKRTMLARMLINLADIYRGKGRLADLEWVQRMRLEIPEVDRQEALSLAETLSAMGRYAEAAADLESRAADDPDPNRATIFLTAARRMRAHLN